MELWAMVDIIIHNLRKLSSVTPLVSKYVFFLSNVLGPEG